jgi:prolipoprotein diacylglyceryltransferase
MIEAFRALFAPPRHFILIVIAMWIGLTIAEKRCERYGISKEQLNSLTFYSLFGFIIGGRLLFALGNLPSFAQSPLSIFSPNPDLFDPAGGALSAILIGFLYGNRQKLSFWATLDAVTPIAATILVGLSLAHLAAGTSFGSPTDLPWGIELWNAVRHPTQIYEFFASLLILGWVLLPKPASSAGILFLHFTALTAGSRLFLEAFRGDSALVFGEFRLAQLIAWSFLAIALFISESVLRRGKRQ